PGRLDDPGRPTIRVGYTEVRVTPEVKRLAVSVTPAASEYRPGETARVRVRVADASGAPRRAEVTLWAVDEGVLALTGYKTPDPIDLLYRERGLGMRLSSNMANVAPQIPEGEKGRRSPGGGGGADRSEVLRSRFQTTAFFLGSVVTGADGQVVATAKLPDNLTTFRVMAVAVTAGDRYGKGESPMLVTRPLVARPALPRFVRAGDDFTAGTVVNQRAGGTPRVTVTASGSGVALRGDARRTATLASGTGVEVRFPFRALPADSASFTFRAVAGSDADGVRLSVPVRPAFHPEYLTVSGTVRDTATVTVAIPDGLDLERSRVDVTLGSSPLAMLRGMYDRYHVYPYLCTEQVTSLGMPLIALWRARTIDSALARRDPRRDLERAVEIIASRQRTDGGIGYWSATDWTSPWLSAYAGRFLLEAKRAGIAVSDTVLTRLGDYLAADLRAASDSVPLIPVASWYADRRVRLADRIAAVDFLSRARRADVAAEHQLLAGAPQLRWEDRLLLAEALARRGEMRDALALVAPAWAEVRLEGNRAVLPPRATDEDFYFASRSRPMARLLTATLAVNPTHPLVGPMVETLVQQGRGAGWWWNTQDVGAVAEALAVFDARQRRAAALGVTVRAGGAGGRVLFAVRGPGARAASTDSGVPLAGLVRGPSDARELRLSVTADGGATGDVAYYYATVREVPAERPVRPTDQGIQVERWYERYDTGAPVTSVKEGDLVRVRLRVTVPVERHFVVLDDALPAGLEAVDLSLRTTAALPGPGAGVAGSEEEGASDDEANVARWWYGSWDSGWWSPWDHREMRDDRVVWAATMLWPGTYTATYVARATTPGTFVRPPAWAEEMYNPAVSGRSDGGRFVVLERRAGARE
ncbi:MAG TPA: alpha-2-macroglobulin family protein, partial [Gemmatimonadaceae bacterium]